MYIIDALRALTALECYRRSTTRQRPRQRPRQLLEHVNYRPTSIQSFLHIPKTTKKRIVLENDMLDSKIEE